MGKDRSSIANMLRLLKLPEEVRTDLSSGAISMGHARAILALADAAAQRHAAREVIARGLSVRDAEALVRRLARGTDAEVGRTTETRTPEPVKDVHTRAAEEKMRFALGTQVRIVRREERGTIEIEYGSEDELNRIYEHITAIK